MAVDTTEKTKKPTVRTLATELNISHDTLIEFLQSKGYSGIKTIMSKIDDDALDVVMKHFGKEKDVAEKRQKKVAAFKEKRVKPTKAEAEAETAKEPEAALKATVAEKVSVEEVTAPVELPPVTKEDIEEAPELPLSEEQSQPLELQPVVAEQAESTEEAHEGSEEEHEAKRKRR